MNTRVNTSECKSSQFCELPISKGQLLHLPFATTTITFLYCHPDAEYDEEDCHAGFLSRVRVKKKRNYYRVHTLLFLFTKLSV